MKALEKNIIDLYAEKGKQWLLNLAPLVAHFEKTLRLSHLKPFENLSYHYVLSGLQGTKPIVLKLGLDLLALKQEAEALKAFAGHGVVQVLAEQDGMLLLERAVSGLSLKSYFPEKDSDAIQISSTCLKRLHQANIPSHHPFPQITDWLKVLDKSSSIPPEYHYKARKLRDNLISTASKSVLLHGDLHQDNVLQNGNDWLAIDPKGVLGEPAYDIAAFIRNPMLELLGHNHVLKIIDKRSTQFAKIFQLSKQRILDWCYVQAVLAWVWAIEDKADETCFKKLTEIFNKLTSGN